MCEFFNGVKNFWSQLIFQCQCDEFLNPIKWPDEQNCLRKKSQHDVKLGRSNYVNYVTSHCQHAFVMWRTAPLHLDNYLRLICFLSTRVYSALGISAIMRYINRRFTYLLTKSLSTQYITGEKPPPPPQYYYTEMHFCNDQAVQCTRWANQGQ